MFRICSLCSRCCSRKRLCFYFSFFFSEVAKVRAVSTMMTIKKSLTSSSFPLFKFCIESDPQKSPLKTNTRILLKDVRRHGSAQTRATVSPNHNKRNFFQTTTRATAEETFCVRSKRSTESELPVARSHEPGELEGGTSGVCDFRRVGRGYRGR